MQKKLKNGQKKRLQRRAKNVSARRKAKFAAAAALLLALIATGFFLKEKLKYLSYVYFTSNKKRELINSRREQDRINKIITANSRKMFGIDLSHYQRTEDINWDSLSIGNGAIPIQFVMLRATMGVNKKDKNFDEFWKKAKHAGLVRGAYLYYRADADPVRQANNYLETVKLETGDFVPVIDIENIPRKKSKEELVSDLKTMSTIFEETFGKKPMIYTYSYYFRDYLKEEFSDYPLWLANYNDVEKPSADTECQIWQFTENGIIHGVNAKIDLDIFDNESFNYKKYLISD